MTESTITSSQATTVIVNTISGDYRIDVLLENVNFRWNTTQALGSAVEVTYSFASEAAYLTDTEDANGLSTFTDSQKTAARQALADVAAVTNLTFSEVTDTASSYGQIRFANNSQGETSAGYALLPDPNENPLAGDVFINNFDTDNLENVVPGTNAYATIMHEMLHGLGLKHPGNYNAGEASTPTPGNYLAASEDSAVNTIMSYIEVAQQQERVSFGPYDLLALQYLYGAKSVNTDNNIYSFDNTAGQKLQLIDDDGGINTIDASAATVPVTINLNQGQSSSIGTLEDGTPAVTNVQIAFGTVIQNTVGTAGNDSFTGNDSSNSFTGGGGNDTIDGGAGIDIAVFIGSRGSHTITSGDTAWTIADTSTSQNGTDVLTNIERLTFTDGSVALDLNGNAGTTAKIIGAVFGAASVANQQYVGIGLSYLDGGMSSADLMALALNAVGATSSTAEVSLLWTNLFGQAPTDTQAAPYVEMLDNGSSTAGGLGIMAADTEFNTTNIGLLGLAETGIFYA